MVVAWTYPGLDGGRVMAKKTFKKSITVTAWIGRTNSPGTRRFTKETVHGVL